LPTSFAEESTVAMIAFATLILGLVLGPVDVTLDVGAGVARVDVLLDGARVAEARAAPWMVAVDFGEELAPHELEAIAFDTAGHEVARARQRINRPRPPAEVSIAVEARGGSRVARLVWGSVIGEQPTLTRVTVDGKPIAFRDPGAIPLPPANPERFQLLHAELDFADGVTTSADIVFAGGRADEAAAELTAVPVSLAPKVRLPKAESLTGWFELRGKPLRVLAVEDGPAEIVAVLETSAKRPLRLLASLRGSYPARETALRERQSLRILWPVARPRPQSGLQYSLFPVSEHLRTLSALDHLATYRTEDPEPWARQRLADAVAAAALDASARNRRRAVVLLLGPDPPTARASRFGEATVRRYLRTIGVPLHVWCVGREEDAVWGACTDVSTRKRFADAFRQVQDDLERQRIVWVEGTHLPQAISLTAKAAGICRLE
jgi:hypothetical protein